MPLFSKDINKCLGIDIGSTSVKVVELSKEDSKISLKNYGKASIEEVTGRRIDLKGGRNIFSYKSLIVETTKKIIEDAEIKTKKNVFSISDTNSFFTSFEVPKMKRSEVESAIQYQARQRIPLPLNQVTLDWRLTNVIEKGGEEMVEVLLLAVPNDIISAYRKIADNLGLKVGSLDSETFGLARVYGKKEKNIAVVDAGYRTTTVNIIEDNIPKHSHSIDLAGKDFVEDVAKLPDINYTKNETSEVSKKIKISLSEDLSNKVMDVCRSYEAENQKEIDKVIATGSSLKIEEVRNSFFERMDAEEGDSINEINYPPALKPITKELSSIFSVSIGMAIEGLKGDK